jgi:hypothetical protein
MLPGSSARRHEDCGLSGALDLGMPVTLSVAMAGETSGGPLPSFKDGARRGNLLRPRARPEP